ncbi:hypothetical protein SBV1_1450056 [Verrucomicrobia bacterium]|nr:hypothetical protein SBV1_1450056 [Verrucomicrobiota bacterium]
MPAIANALALAGFDRGAISLPDRGDVAPGSEASYCQDIAGGRLVTKLVNRNYPNLRRHGCATREYIDIRGHADGAVE